MRSKRHVLAFCAMICAALFAICAPRAFAADYVEGEVLVTVKLRGVPGDEPTTDEIRAAAEAAAVRAEAYVAYVYEAVSKASGMASALLRSDTLTTERMIELLSVLPDVVSASPNYVMKLEADAPNDPYFLNDWAWGMRAIGADKAWLRTTGRDDIYVAVIDSGINVDHEDLAGNLAEPVYRKNYMGIDGSELSTPDQNVNDTYGHGSHVAGIIGAVGNNGKGVAGVNWRVKLMPYRITGPGGAPSGAALLAAINDIYNLASGANAPKIAAVNMSIGGWNQGTLDGFLAYYKFGQLANLGRAPLIAASAGNEALEHDIKDTARAYNNGSSGSAPADSHHIPSALSRISPIIISVAATAKDKSAYPYTNWSEEHVDVAAPGNQIYSTVSGGNSAYDYKWGTSMAAPHVAGAAALLAARLEGEGRGDEWNGAMLKQLLIDTADGGINPTSGSSNGNKISKYGQIDLAAAMESLDIKIKAIDVVVAPSSAAQGLSLGSQATLTAVIAPDKATDKKVRWSANNSNITFVSSDDTTAVISAAQVGQVTITATADDGTNVTGGLTLSVISDAHVHDYADKWSSDGTSHWKECKAGDGARDALDAHSGGAWDTTSEPGYHSKKCVVCDAPYSRGAHTTSAANWDHDASGHWKVCDDCGARMEEAGHRAGGVEGSADGHRYPCAVCREPLNEAPHSWNDALEHNDFKHMRKCGVCGYQETPGTDHDWSDSWEKDERYHWHRCSTSGCAATNAKAEHSDANVDYRCDVCDAALGRHVHSGAGWQTSAETHWKSCPVCLELYDIGPHDSEYRANDDDHWTLCKVCGHEGDRVPHRWGNWGESAVEHWRECSDCGKADALAPHTFDADGICTVCGRYDPSKEEVLPTSTPTSPPTSSPTSTPTSSPTSTPGGQDSVIDGQDFAWIEGGGDRAVVIDLPPTSFLNRVIFNGRQLVEGAEYTFGSEEAEIRAADALTRIVFTDQLFDRLRSGSYTATAKFVGHDVDIRFTVSRISEPDGSVSGGGDDGGGCGAIAPAGTFLVLCAVSVLLGGMGGKKRGR